MISPRVPKSRGCKFAIRQRVCLDTSKYIKSAVGRCTSNDGAGAGAEAGDGTPNLRLGVCPKCNDNGNLRMEGTRQQTYPTDEAQALSWVRLWLAV